MLIPEARNTLVSCSNDTTIKVWKMDNLNKIKDKKTVPFSTLNDHEDSVRCIDYSKQQGKLVSASDDGQIFLWDLSCEKLLQKYNIQENENRNYDENQITFSADLLSSKSCPTAMATSTTGNLVFIAFSDNSLKMIDTRIPEKNG